MSNSEDEYFNINDWPCQCFCSESSESDNSGIITNDYDDFNTENKRVFISIFNQKGVPNCNVISNSIELQQYHLKYKQLQKKTPKNIQKIWEDIRINNQYSSNVPIKCIITNNKSLKSRKKKTKKPTKNNPITHLIKTEINSYTRDEQSDIPNDKKLSEAEINQKRQKEMEIQKKINLNLKEFDKTIKNTTDQIVKMNSDVQNVKSNIENRQSNVVSSFTEKSNIKNNSYNNIDKENLLKLNAKTNLKNETLNDDINNENIKSETVLFKIPNSRNIIKTHNEVLKENIDIQDKMFQSNLIEQHENKKIGKQLKKREKKKRQREKRLGAREESLNFSSRDVSTSSSNRSFKYKNSKNISNNNAEAEVGTSRKKTAKKVEKKTIQEKKFFKSSKSEHDVDKSDNELIDNSNEDLDFFSDPKQMSTFVSSIFKRTQNLHAIFKQYTSNSTENTDKRNIEKAKEKTKINEEQFVKTKQLISKKVPDATSIQYSEYYAEKAIEMILKNDLNGGLKNISLAINYYNDCRHYLNRSYCYLRLNQYNLALADAQYVIQTSSNDNYLYYAFLRAGQACNALQNYKEAENYLNEATGINPENYYAQRELIRIKISTIINLGFKEKDVLVALKEYPATNEAIYYLIENDISSTSIQNNINIDDDNYDNVIYSSDVDEESNNFETLNNMLNYKPGDMNLQSLTTKSKDRNYVLGSSTCNKTYKLKITPDYMKTLSLPNKNANDKAIWVGNLNNSISDEMLKKKFKQFGKIISVYRPSNETYAFINFDKCEDVRNALLSTSHEIAGVKVTVRTAFYQK